MKRVNFIILSLIPFLIFFSIYFILSEYFFRYKKIIVENFVGKNLNDLVFWSSKNGILVKILKINHNYSKENGYIVSQIPKAGASINSQNPISVEIIFNKKIKVPEIINLHFESGKDIILENGFYFEKRFIPCLKKPSDIILCNSEENENNILIYVSRSIKKEIIIGDLVGDLCLDAKKNLEALGLVVICLNKNSEKIGFEHNYVVVEQRPKKGNIILKDNILYLFHF